MKLTIVLLVALCVLALVYETSAKKRAGKRYRRDADENEEGEGEEMIDDDDDSECDCPCKKPSRPAGLMCFEIGETKFFGGAGKPFKKPRKPCKPKDNTDEDDDDEEEEEEEEPDNGPSMS